MLRSALLLGLFSPSAAAQAFVDNSTDIPQGSPGNDSETENVDFADIDLDGDWDAVFADGGFFGNDQNRVWVNAGGLQGGAIGVFVDETATRVPAVHDNSRDVEFVDFDSDGDYDVYIANSSNIAVQGSRWWVNNGGAQGGTLGFYTDETAQRWVGLNSANSSIPDSLLLPDATSPETFIDWSCDCDFGDLDNDGDMDLVHSSYGDAFSGRSPTRLFLNDGDGHYEEFNPSGFQPTGSGFPPGVPGLWCEGTQEDDTTSTDGTHCDITSHALDIDVVDFDNDMDLDILHGNRQGEPRIFYNRFEENGGSPGFRDVTHLVLPVGFAPAKGNYEQEFGDMDGDADADIWGVNWQGGLFSFEDGTFRNDGSGVFTEVVAVPTSELDDDEIDFIDYDNDGDVDAWIARGLGPDRLFRNDTGGGALTFTSVDALLPGIVQSGSDADVCDLDGDGDYDVFSVGYPQNYYFENVLQVPDTTAPWLARLDSVTGHAAVADFDPVRVQMYDNAPYYVAWYNDVQLVVDVDGTRLPDLPMVTSGGQVFRGTLPGNLVGSVEYHATASDEYGNAGASTSQSFTNTGPVGTLGGTSSPSSVGTPTLRSLTAPFGGMPLHLVGADVAPGTAGFFFFSLTTLPGLDLGDGLVLNVGFPLLASPLLVFADSTGEAVLSVGAVGPAASGLTIHAQYLAADGAGGATWASTQRLELDFQ